VVNPTSQRQSRPHDQRSDHPMTAPSVPERALAWVRASDDTNTRRAQTLSSSTYPRTRAPYHGTTRRPLRREAAIWSRAGAQIVLWHLAERPGQAGFVSRAGTSLQCATCDDPVLTRRASTERTAAPTASAAATTASIGMPFCLWASRDSALGGDSAALPSIG
jgi:hypothetical protein